MKKTNKAVMVKTGNYDYSGYMVICNGKLLKRFTAHNKKNAIWFVNNYNS